MFPLHCDYFLAGLCEKKPSLLHPFACLLNLKLWWIFFWRGDGCVETAGTLDQELKGQEKEEWTQTERDQV